MGAAAQLFHSSDSGKDTLNKRIRPDNDQMEFLREKKDDLEAYLREDLSQRCDCAISTWLQGSYKFHTLIRPVHKSASYDVDVGIYLEWGRAEGELFSAGEVRHHLQDSLQEFQRLDASVQRIEDPPKERCSRAHYNRSFHIDTPAYHHHAETRIARLATLTNGWEYSDPEKMVQWFQARLDGDERAQVRRLTRYLKAWAALRFSKDKDSLPSSLLLTVLTVDAYADAVGQRVESDDDAVREIVRSIYRRLRNSRHVENPVTTDQDRDLNRLNDAGFAKFMDALSQMVDTAQRATDCDDETLSAAIWTEVFDYLLPLPDVTGLVEETDSQHGLTVAAPNIRIDISRSKGGASRSHSFGEVGLVRRNEWLRFSITNPEVIPSDAVVRWVVRNVGDDAYRENDLGHSETDDGTFVHHEHAEYHGRHFMDCEVRMNGRLRSITRVPVQISSLQVPPRNPPRPAYTKFRYRK